MIKKDRHKLSKTALVDLSLGLLGVPLVAEATVYSTVYNNLYSNAANSSGIAHTGCHHSIIVGHTGGFGLPQI
jgi:hypothetical protein